MNQNPHTLLRQPVLPLAVISVAVGFTMVLIWIGVIAISSRNYFAEGPDTKLARDLQMPLDTIFRSLREIGLPYGTTFALTFCIPVTLFALLTFPILRASKRRSLGHTLEVIEPNKTSHSNRH